MPAPVAVVPKKVEIQIEDGAGSGCDHQGRLTAVAQAGSNAAPYDAAPVVSSGPRSVRPHGDSARALL